MSDDLLISGFLGRYLHLKLRMNPAVGCRYFLLGPQLPSQLHSVTASGW